MIEPALLFGGRYEIGPLIGRGGMAEVRSGHDTRLDRPVAIKLLRPEMAHQPGVRSRFESEARLAARLFHPNVVAVFDSGEADGVPFIVMERLPGDTLQDRLAAGPLSEGEVRAMAAEVLSALQAAHDAGVLHRDIKPGNVLAAAGQGWKVGDFGIAKALELDRADLTATGLLIGTPAYLAPERFLGSPATVASDLYSLGVVLYEALTGRRPFHADRPEAWASVVTGMEAPALEWLRPGLDPALAAVVDRCLARDPADRFTSAAAAAEGLTGRVPAGREGFGTGARPRSARPGGGWAGVRPAGDGGGDLSGADDATRVAAAPTRDRAPAETEMAIGSTPARPATEVLPVSDRFRRMGLRGRSALAASIAILAVVVFVSVALSGGHGGAAPPSTAATPASTAAATGGTSGLPPALGRAIGDLRHQVTRGR